MITAFSFGLLISLASASVDPTGHWFGEATITRGTWTLQVHVERRPELLAAEVHILEQDLRYPASIGVEGDSLHFRIESLQHGTIAFEGTCSGDRIQGTVRGPSGEHPFALARYVEPEAEWPPPPTGWFETPAGEERFVMPRAHGGLSWISVDAGSFARGERLPLAPDRYFRSDESGRRDQEMNVVRGPEGQAIAIEVRTGQETERWNRIDGPFEAEVVTYPSGDLQMVGLWLKPRSTKASAVWIHGSGPNCTREHFYSFYMADHLARRGIAMLLPDKRGCGMSGGDWRSASIDDLASDARAGLTYLRGQGAKRLGLIGFSQGGWILPTAAAGDSELAFVVSLSGGALSWRENLAWEMEQMGRSARLDSVQLAELMHLQELAMQYGEHRTDEAWSKYREALDSALHGSWAGRGVAEGYPKQSDHWRWRSGAALAGANEALERWKAVQSPALFLFGEDDTQVPIARTVEALRKALKELDHRIEVFPGSGHALEDPSTGWIRDSVFDQIEQWSRKR
ncbi:MAG: alpha/beta hydrolase [Planctomycetota bacterium]